MNQLKRLKILILLPEDHSFGGTPLKFRYYKNISINNVSLFFLDKNKILLLKYIFSNKIDHVHCAFKKPLFFSILFKFIFPFVSFTHHYVNTDKLDFTEYLLTKIAIILKFKFICPTNAIAIAKEVKSYSVIYNGAKKINKNNNNRDPNMILSVGGLNNYKNHINLIKALKYLDSNLKLYIVGDGPLRMTLKTLINKLNLNSRVTLVGYADPFKYYNKCSLYIHPSVSEGFGISTVEAVLSNANICLSDIETHKELYGNFNVNFFNPHDPCNIAKQINISINKKLDSNLFEFAKNNLTINSFSQKLDTYAENES